MKRLKRTVGCSTLHGEWARYVSSKRRARRPRLRRETWPEVISRSETSARQLPFMDEAGECGSASGAGARDATRFPPDGGGMRSNVAVLCLPLLGLLAVGAASLSGCARVPSAPAPGEIVGRPGPRSTSLKPRVYIDATPSMAGFTVAREGGRYTKTLRSLDLALANWQHEEVRFFGFGSGVPVEATKTRRPS